MSSSWVLGVTLALTAQSAVPVSPAGTAAEPVVAVWYRGTPAGEPRADDLAVIRALDFTGVAWPTADTAAARTIRRLAADVDLAVALRSARVPLAADSALKPAETVDIAVDKTPHEQIPALAWRAVAHGARVICFDAGQSSGAGVSDSHGASPPWLRPAQAFARHLSSNAQLIKNARLAPPPIVERPTAPGLDVVLLDGGRAWVVIATNTAARSIGAVVRLPRPVPYAIWISLIDGSDLAMLNEPTGPSWRLELEAGGARVYVIDKILK